MTVKWIFCSQNSSTERYQYTSNSSTERYQYTSNSSTERYQYTSNSSTERYQYTSNSSTERYQYTSNSSTELYQYTSNSSTERYQYTSNSSTERYQYTSKAAVFKLSLWVHWHFMLLMCCRLQKLRVSFCNNMRDRGLLEGIGSLHELTSLRLAEGLKLTAQALSEFLHRPSMTSIVSLDLSDCTNLDDDGLKGIAKRCNKLTNVHV